MFNYAQINEQGYCVGIASLSGEVLQDDMIPIESYDLSYINRKYDRHNKKWTDEYLPIPEPQIPVTLEDIKGDTAPIKETTMLTADDALTIMEIQLSNEDKLNRILAHLGLQ
ncbi:hypothetical protein [Zhenhengia yiwuensis]|uniref:hypothetical protein n=1 Tax=Zhenhengia yiwuensis TaxID=2763666 RepID=UPI002A74E016|nr:hypothetical protein [Zhenhengia yiwuensis]MDY3369308.1 hypothetical protein [Zhenhengia yiwuensis]